MKIFQSSIEAIVADRQSGSSGLLNRLTESCSAYLKRNGSKENIESVKELIAAIPDRLHHFPVLGHFCNQLLMCLNDDPSYAQRFINRYGAEWQDHLCRIAGTAVRILKPGGKHLMTHSNSSTVHLFFTTMKQQGLEAEIIQCRSMPGEEGMVQRAFLHSLGFSVRLIADDEVPNWIEDVDIALIGADAIGSNHIYNKVGSRNIAEYAQSAGTDFCVIADPRKCLSGASEQLFRTAISAETGDGAPANRFEWVERKLCTHLFFSGN